MSIAAVQLFLGSTLLGISAGLIYGPKVGSALSCFVMGVVYLISAVLHSRAEQ